MTSPHTIDDVAPDVRAQLHTLRAQQTQVRTLLADLSTVKGDDAFFAVAVSEREEAANADRVLSGEITLLEQTLRDDVRAWRTDRRAQCCADLKPDLADVFKGLEQAARAMARVQQTIARHHQQTADSTWMPEVPYLNLPTAVPDAKARARREGVL